MKTFNELCKTFLSEKIVVTPKDRTNVNKATLKKGAKVEHEHTPSQSRAETIAIQHMKEFGKKDKDGNLNSDYYKELDDMEKRLKKKLHESSKPVNAEKLSELNKALCHPWILDIEHIERAIRRLLEYFVTLPMDKTTTITIPNLRHILSEGQPLLKIENYLLKRQIKYVLDKLTKEGILWRSTVLGGKHQYIEVQGWAFTDKYKNDNR